MSFFRRSHHSSSRPVASTSSRARDEIWQRFHGWLQTVGYSLDFAAPVGLDPYIQPAVEIRTQRPVILQYVDDDSQANGNLVWITKDHQSNPKNHCVRVENVLRPQNGDTCAIYVFPYLRDLDSMTFRTVAEVVNFLQQMLEGICFLHDLGVVHMDISCKNIMLAGQDQVQQNRPQYFFIGFSISRYFEEEEPRVCWGDDGTTDLTVPEFSEYAPRERESFDPFAIDVYVLGNLIKRDLIEGNPDTRRTGYHGLSFLRPLATAMTQPDPTHRPSIRQALEEFHALLQGMDQATLHSGVRRRSQLPNMRGAVSEEGLIRLWRARQRILRRYRQMRDHLRSWYARPVDPNHDHHRHGGSDSHNRGSSNHRSFQRTSRH